LSITVIIIIGAVVLAVLGVLLGVILIFSRRSQQLNNQYGAEFDRSVKAIGEVKKD